MNRLQFIVSLCAIAFLSNGCVSTERAFAQEPVPAQPQVPQQILIKTETLNALVSFLNDSRAVFRLNGMNNADEKAAAFIAAIQQEASAHIQELNKKETEKTKKK